jgi:hypothetical protein
VIERRLHHSLYELMWQDRYTPEEAAELLQIGIDVLRHAAFTGELPSQIIEHDIISLQRDDVLTWLRESDVRGGDPPIPVVGGKGTDYGTRGVR